MISTTISQQMAQRKDDHVQLALSQAATSYSDFERLRFVHHSFAPLSLENIQLTTHWANTTHSLPFYINGMTGGSAFTKKINAQLAEVAKETGLAMATGSVSVAMKDSAVSDSFTIVRDIYPDGFIMANLGAHHTLDNAKKAVDLLQANALQIHLNIPQEVVMPEGDRDFTTWSHNIEQMAQHLEVPIIVKEVGFGMSRQTIEHLIQLGVKYIDVGGNGGTNFIAIENARRQTIDFSLLHQWGQSTVESLLESLPYQSQATILASGGIRHYLDIAKSLALGARSVGLSGKFLHTLHHEGVQATIDLVREWEYSLRHLMLMLGCPTIRDLAKTDIIVDSQLAHWATLRHIDIVHLANRHS